jgi:acyl-CoA synthetase (AMP-forming)/AMP-acid ligase II
MRPAPVTTATFPSSPVNVKPLIVVLVLSLVPTSASARRTVYCAHVDTFWDLVVRAAEAQPHTLVASDDHGRSLTRADLRDRAEQVAAGLVQHGVSPGDTVSWQLPTTLESLVLLVALARLGAVQNPLIPLLREREVGFITSQVGTDTLLVPTRWRNFDHEAMAKALAVQRPMQVLAVDLDSLDDGGLRLPTADPSALPPPPTGADDVRWIYYSSGTTAQPKGARHNDTTIFASSNALLAGVGFGRDDVYPIAWPTSHIGGASMLTVSLRGGVHLVLFDTFDPVGTPARMAEHEPTIVGTAVPFFRAFLDAQRRMGDTPLFRRLRVGAFGGAPVPAEVHDEMRAAFGVPLVGSWGLTEFPNASSAAPGDPTDVLTTSVGRAGPHVSVRAVADDGRECATGEEGELRLRGPQCFLGYVDAALDADAFDDDGWFRTGDLGRIDADGNVRITGRLKDIIIRNAENISVIEIEELLYRHPAIDDAAVFGMPDPRTGERVCAAVVLREGAQLDLPALRDHCRAEGLALQKCPEQLEVVGELPRNSMGKVLKQDLRRNLEAKP